MKTQHEATSIPTAAIQRNALAELRDKSAGRLAIGANESSTLYLLDSVEQYRKRFGAELKPALWPSAWTTAR